MPTLSNEEILNAIAEKPVMEIVDLVKMMEEKFDVSAAVAATAAAPVAVAGTAVGGAAAAEKTAFDIHLKSFGSNKIAVIKVIREITGLGLKEAKELVEKAPTSVKESVSKEDAEKFKKKLEEAGAEIEIK